MRLANGLVPGDGSYDYEPRRLKPHVNRLPGGP